MSCLKDFFVPHPSAERLFKKMDMIMSMPRKVVAPCLLCLGQGGVGKTSMIEELGRRNITSVNRIVTVTMHQNADNMGLKELILAEMGLDTSRRARQSRRISPDLQHLIKSQNIKAIVIDEVHDALTLSPFQRKVNLSLLKNLSGSTYGLSVFAFGVPDAARFLREDPQLARRYAVHDLETWSNGQDVRNFVFSYIHRLPLKKPTDFRDQELCLAIVEKSLGITDNIVKILQASAWAAIADGTERITLKHVRDVEAIMSMELGTSLQGLHDVSMEQDCA
ncbi:TniB family NTP-binding protein [Pseudomonas palleroniana]|nr:TniB family NTP-binding protein [Pseudomonas palleroniana]